MRPLLIVVALLALACATAQPPTPKREPGMPPGWTADTTSGEIVHVASGFRFREQRLRCMRGEARAYDASGENVSIGYDCPSGVWLTFYVYPKSPGETPSDHFRVVLGEIAAAHEKVQLDRAVETNLPLGARTLPGYVAFLRWREPLRDVGSLTLLIPDGTRFVKVRASFPLDGSNRLFEEALQLGEALLRSAAPGA